MKKEQDPTGCQAPSSFAKHFKVGHYLMVKGLVLWVDGYSPFYMYLFMDHVIGLVM